MFTIIVIAIIILAVLMLYNTPKKVCLPSTINNTTYCVLPDTDERMTETVNTLAEIDTDIKKLIEYIKIHGDVGIANTLQQKYTSNLITEAVIKDEYTSYTINKKKVHMCLRSRDEPKHVYDKNTLLYVMIHELAHVICKSTGHTPEFKALFKILADNAVKAGIYKYIDYSSNNVDYCGLRLSSSILN